MLVIVSTPYVLQARISYFLAMTVPASHAFLPFRNSLSPILQSHANIARRHQPNVGREFGRRLNPQFTWNSNNHPPKREPPSFFNTKFDFPLTRRKLMFLYIICRVTLYIVHVTLRYVYAIMYYVLALTYFI